VFLERKCRARETHHPHMEAIQDENILLGEGKV
jgi:hypothetical protein